jgi:hypothetical protein
MSVLSIMVYLLYHFAELFGFDMDLFSCVTVAKLTPLILLFFFMMITDLCLKVGGIGQLKQYKNAMRESVACFRFFFVVILWLSCLTGSIKILYW